MDPTHRTHQPGIRVPDMRHTVALYLIGHRAGLALGLFAVAVAVSTATGTTNLPLPWLTEGSLDLSVDHLLAVGLLAAHVTLLTGELPSREEAGVRPWWWADGLGAVLLLSGPVVLTLSGDAGLLQNTLLYLTLFFLIALAIIIPISVFYAGVFGPEAALFSDLFPPDVRYTGISIVYQFPGFLVAGIVPGLCTFLINWNEGDPLYVCLFTLLAAVTSALSAFAIQRKSIAAQRKHGDDAEHI